MNLTRLWKSWWYPLFPSISIHSHQKRRKGLYYRACLREGLECQQEQDRFFWEKFLHPEPSGRFLEVGGDGVTGSHTLGLELKHGWKGCLRESAEMPRKRAAKVRSCEILSGKGILNLSEPIQLLAFHRPRQFPDLWEALETGRLRADWVVVENSDGDPKWANLLCGKGYKFKLFFHDDEYFHKSV